MKYTLNLPLILFRILSGRWCAESDDVVVLSASWVTPCAIKSATPGEEAAGCPKRCMCNSNNSHYPGHDQNSCVAYLQIIVIQVAHVHH